MGYQDIRLGQSVITELKLACAIRAIYQQARRMHGLRGRAALHRACRAYAALRPDVPAHLVPQRVAKFLDPNMPVDGGARQ